MQNKEKLVVVLDSQCVYKGIVDWPAGVLLSPQLPRPGTRSPRFPPFGGHRRNTGTAQYFETVNGQATEEALRLRHAK